MTTEAKFDPRNHRLCETRYFDDFKVGERFNLPSRTMTDGLFAAFSLASGDNHPVHYDVEYCRAHGMPHMLAHGFQVVAQTCPGAGMFPHMVDEEIRQVIAQHATGSLGWKLSGAGGGGYLILVRRDAVPGALRIKVRRSSW